MTESQVFLAVLSLTLLFQTTFSFYDPHCNGKTVIVHLFEWRWGFLLMSVRGFSLELGTVESRSHLPMIDPGNKKQIFEFRPGTKDLCSLNNLRGGLFSDKINLDAKNPPP